VKRVFGHLGLCFSFNIANNANRVIYYNDCVLKLNKSVDNQIHAHKLPIKLNILKQGIPLLLSRMCYAVDMSCYIICSWWHFSVRFLYTGLLAFV